MSNYRSKFDPKVPEALKALSNPTRLEIFKRLVECCGAIGFCADRDFFPCVGELGSGLQIAPSTISHHLKELRVAGLIEVERRGKNVYCKVSKASLKELADFFDALCSECLITSDEEHGG